MIPLGSWFDRIDSGIEIGRQAKLAESRATLDWLLSLPLDERQKAAKRDEVVLLLTEEDRFDLYQSMARPPQLLPATITSHPPLARAWEVLSPNVVRTQDNIPSPPFWLSLTRLGKPLAIVAGVLAVVYWTLMPPHMRGVEMSQDKNYYRSRVDGKWYAVPSPPTPPPSPVQAPAPNPAPPVPRPLR